MVESWCQMRLQLHAGVRLLSGTAHGPHPPAPPYLTMRLRLFLRAMSMTRVQYLGGGREGCVALEAGVREMIGAVYRLVGNVVVVQGVHTCLHARARSLCRGGGSKAQGKAPKANTITDGCKGAVLGGAAPQCFLSARYVLFAPSAGRLCTPLTCHSLNN